MTDLGDLEHGTYRDVDPLKVLEFFKRCKEAA